MKWGSVIFEVQEKNKKFMDLVTLLVVWYAIAQPSCIWSKPF